MSGPLPPLPEDLAAHVLGVVQRAVGLVLEVDPAGVAPSLRLREDLEADSLALVEVVEVVEEELEPLAGGAGSFVVDDDALEGLRTVGDAVEHALGLLRARRAA